MLNTIESVIEWVHLPFGQPLFHQGDSGSDFFLLINGRLQVSIRDCTGTDRNIAEIKRGTIVGEMAMFTGESRTASIYAMRDSDLVKFSRQAFERMISAHPNIMMHFIRFIIRRMQEISAVSRPENRTLNIAVIPAGPSAPLAEFSHRLVAALSGFGKTLHINSKSLDQQWGIPGMAQATGSDPNNIRLSSWLDEQEANYTNIVYEADLSPTAWTRRCIQHADRIIIAAGSDSSPILTGIETELYSPDRRINRAHHILVLLHPDGSRLPAGTDQWLNKRQIDSHYHVRWNSDADFKRLARFLTGNAVGLVLGGGGARGLAHIGVIRALNEAGVPIDMIGGTSMGAMVSAQYAIGMDYKTMIDVQKETIALKPFREFTLPFIALTKSKRLEKLINRLCGDTNIEDMWVNFFCISSNLTSADMVVHRKGSLAKSIRASGALPGILRPVLEKNCLLVDGALFNNVPADVMKELCGGLVIMVNVSPDEDLKVPDRYQEIPGDMEILWSRLSPFRQKIDVPGILDIMIRTIMVGSANKENQARKAADYEFHPPVRRFGLLEFEAIDEIIDTGYRYAKEKIRELQNNGLLGG
jgi:NTE family protein/lysophospholipid hydrolase